jgi:hypothetical protein
VTAEDELRWLAASHLTPDIRIWVGHFFSHFGSEWNEREAFRTALREAEFGRDGTIRSDIEGSDDWYWHHSTYTRVKASPRACLRLERLAARIAEEHGVRYDDWMIARHDDIPRDFSGSWLS